MRPGAVVTVDLQSWRGFNRYAGPVKTRRWPEEAGFREIWNWLRARIGAVLRRRESHRDGPSRVGDLTIDPIRRKVTLVAGLRPTPKTLQPLIRNPLVTGLPAVPLESIASTDTLCFPGLRCL